MLQCFLRCLAPATQPPQSAKYAEQVQTYRKGVGRLEKQLADSAFSGVPRLALTTPKTRKGYRAIAADLKMPGAEWQQGPHST